MLYRNTQQDLLDILILNLPDHCHFERSRERQERREYLFSNSKNDFFIAEQRFKTYYAIILRSKIIGGTDLNRTNTFSSSD